MIIFYNKQNGDIIGTINGRVHTKEHLNMWIGNKEETERIVCQWKKNDTGEMKPDTQPELFEKIEKEKGINKKYKIDINTKSIREKNEKEMEIKEEKLIEEKSSNPMDNQYKIGKDLSKILMDIIQRLNNIEKKLS